MQIASGNDSGHTSTRRKQQDLAFCIVWSPLPPITWILPFIGHLGICDSRGIASDFRGPYYVGDDGQMAFGAPTRALFIPHEDAREWDEAIQAANALYQTRMHNICCDNCHSHVANALNRMNAKAYGVSGDQWNMIKLAALLFFKGRFLNAYAVYAQFGPFLILLLLIVLPITLMK